MKSIVNILILLLLTQFCFSQNRDLIVKYESFEINIPGTPGPWIKQNGKFYSYFRTDNDLYSTASTDHFYILDKKGKIKSRITVPRDLQSSYHVLYLNNNSILTTESFHRNTFVLDEQNKKWVETKKGIDLYYRDDIYNVYSIDMGEWGAVTWFENIRTNKQYELAASSPIVNRLNNSYYLTLGNRIVKIADPHKLELSKDPYDYKKAAGPKRYYRTGSSSQKGAETIYEFKSDNQSSPPYFATSFIANNKLFHVYKDRFSTKIGVIQDGRLTPVYEFKEQIHPVLFSYDSRLAIQNNEHQTFQFTTSNQNKYGIVEIYRDTLTVTTFTNSYREAELGEIKLKEWFENNFAFYYKNFNKLHLKSVDSIEQRVHATDLTQNHKMSHILLQGKNIETPRIYRKFESPQLRLSTMYYYTAKEKSVELLDFEWRKFRAYEPIDDLVPRRAEADSTFQARYKWISNYLITILGSPTRQSTEKSSATQEWTAGQKVVKLSYNEFHVQLIMYKK